MPGSAVGVLGSGQLGRMFAIAARRMGYRVHTYSPDTDTPTGQVADVEVVGEYGDLERVRAFAREVVAGGEGGGGRGGGGKAGGRGVITFEFENVPFETAQAAAEVVPVRPAGKVLHITQHRLREKTFLRDAGFPVAPFEHVRSAAELHAALGRIGAPAILKTAGWGYDGKGQARIATAADADRVWASLGTSEAVLEGFIHFEREASVVFARSVSGEFVHWGVTENQHVGGILDLSIAPARLPEKVAKEAVRIAHAVAEAIGLVGVMCVEFFVTRGGGLIINELAPRPHNSGHWTFDFSATSQFEQQLRAVCNLPLGATDLLTPSGAATASVAMAQLLGDLWLEAPGGVPDFAAALTDPRMKLHLYGKHEARAGRKMGHLTAWGDTPDDAAAAVLEARQRLSGV